jgi:hypothetical protein
MQRQQAATEFDAAARYPAGRAVNYEAIQSIVPGRGYSDVAEGDAGRARAEASRA